MTGNWIEAHGSLTALLSGMVGAAKGWVEAPYCSLPAGADQLAGALVRVDPDAPVWIVPGITTLDAQGVPDVIRGEEIQAVAAAGETDRALVVLPGTHSKWVDMQDGQIMAFSTYMTGDLHAAILGHTVIAQLSEPDGAGDREAFLRGVDIGFSQHGNLTHILFGGRTRVLFGDLAAGAVPDYVSGLLIGAEIASAFSALDGEVPTITLVGSDRLCVAYRIALESRGATVIDIAPDAIGRAYADLARRAGLLESKT